MTIKLSQGSDHYLNYKFMKILAEYSFCPVIVILNNNLKNALKYEY